MAKRMVVNKQRLTVVVCIAVLVLCLIGALIFRLIDQNNKYNKMDDIAESAIGALEAVWVNVYDDAAEYIEQDGSFAVGREDRVIEIKGTRIIEINGEGTEAYKDIDYIVEFDLYSNRFRTSPYHVQEDIYNSVVVYNDGTVEASFKNILRSYADDFDSDMVIGLAREIHEMGDRYDRIIDIK